MPRIPSAKISLSSSSNLFRWKIVSTLLSAMLQLKKGGKKSLISWHDGWKPKGNKTLFRLQLVNRNCTSHERNYGEVGSIVVIDISESDRKMVVTNLVLHSGRRRKPWNWRISHYGLWLCCCCLLLFLGDLEVPQGLDFKCDTSPF